MLSLVNASSFCLLFDVAVHSFFARLATMIFDYMLPIPPSNIELLDQYRDRHSSGTRVWLCMPSFGHNVVIVHVAVDWLGMCTPRVGWQAEACLFHCQLVLWDSFRILRL